MAGGDGFTAVAGGSALHIPVLGRAAIDFLNVRDGGVYIDATFGGGGIPDRNEQLAAQSLGVAKYSALQSHIDNMARPTFGVGFFGGFN